jgi:tRNA A-37 threonylcarbamoyl transferase component Bud32
MAETSPGLIGGRYRVLDTLGKGAMGLVFMAYDPVLDRKVAIKRMTAEIADDEELRRRFYVEARAAARLNHPNIITIHELQEASGEIFMIMELLEGKALSALVDAAPVPLSLQATLDVMGHVCDGLDYAHQRAIIHRDIKPANLFLTSSGTVKILDFGIARLGTLHLTAAGALVGTPDYMAPEQIRGDEIDRRTDLWAVGAVLYQLLSGTKPFEGRPLAKLLSAIARTPHIPLQQRAPAVPKSVSDLVDRLLSKPRDGRPASAGLVRDELRAILGRESSAPPQTRLAYEAWDETVLMEAPAKPQAPATVRAAAVPPPVATTPPAPALPPPVPAEIGSTVEATRSGRTAVLATPEMTPPTGSMAATAASAVQQPPAAASTEPPPVAAITPPAPAAAPERKWASRLMVAAIAVGVVGLFVVAGLAGAGWWWWSSRQQRTGTGSDQPNSAATTASQPPAPPQPSGAALPPAPPPASPPAPATPVPGAVAGRPASQDATIVESPPAPPQTAPPSVAPVAQAPPNAQPQTQPQTQPPIQTPIQTGVAARAGGRPGVSEDTVEALSGRQPGQAYDANTATSVQAAVSRINYVLEQYVRALVNADADAIREYRSALSPEENALMRARQLKVRLEDVRIEVAGAEATARCRRKIVGTSASGAPLQEDVAAVYRLVRKPAGWVITDVR